MSIETMKLALELLDRQWQCSGVWSLEESQDIAEALRQAIEKAQEPVANDWSVFNTGAEVASGLSLSEAWDYLTPERLERGWSAVCVINKENQITPPPQRQPEQEPVAWRWKNAGQDKWLNKYTYLDNGAPDYPEECEPLYTSPPQRQPLTDESTKIMREMLEVQGQHGNWNYDSYMHGLYNGMEYMVALAEKREPKFRDAPDEWLAKYEVKRDNFNNVVECKPAHDIKGKA